MDQYCPQCGAPVKAGAIKCEYCDAAINNGDANTSANTQPQQTVYVNVNQPNQVWPIKSKVAAGILALFLGGIGIHKFYLGKTGQGILMLLFCWTYIPSIIGFIEGIIILCSNDENFQNKYHVRIG